MNVSSLKNLIAENKISQVLIEIKGFVSSDDKYKYLESKLLLLLSRYNTLRNEEVKGTLSKEDISIKYNRLRDEILNIIEEIEKPNKFRWIIQDKFSKKAIQLTLIPLIITALTIGVCFFFYNFHKQNKKADLVLLNDSFDTNDSPYEISNDIISLKSKLLFPKNQSILTDDENYFTQNESDTIAKNNLRYKLIIDKINSDFSYSFPTIDFKFLNNGGSTAVITEFQIERIELKLNPKPDLEFKWDVSDRNLHITVNNYGWGDALECECELINPNLKNLYHKEKLIFQGEINSEKEKLLFNLSVDDVKYQSRKNLKRDSVEKNLNPFMNKGDYIGRIYMECSYYDRNIKHYKEKIILHPSKEYLTLYINENGFIKANFGGIDEIRVQSPITYVSFIDKNEDLLYPTLHEIKSGETERFHIMIAAYKSCFAKVKLNFKTNNNEIIETEPFMLNIWSPKGKLRKANYTDGEILTRILTDSDEETL